MNKLGLSIAAAAVLLLLGLPPVLGGMTRSQVEARVAALDAHPLVSATVVDYDRGWFSSAAKVEIGIDTDYVAQIAATRSPNLPAEAPPEPAPIAVDFAHGPVAFGDGVHLGWSSFVARLDPDDPDTQALLARLGVPYLFEFRGRTDFGGTVRFDADIPAIEMNDPDAQVTFTGATLAGSLAGRDLRWDLAAERLRAQGAGGTFAADGVSGSGDLELRSQYFVIGSADLHLQGVQAAGPFGEPLLELVELSVEGGWELDPAGELATGTVTYSVGELRAAQVDLTDAMLGITMANVDAAALEAYYETVQRSLTANPGGPPDGLAEQLGPVIQRALARSPSLTLEPIRFRWRNEPLDADVRAAIDAAKLPPAAAFDMANPFVWLDATRVDARATLSKVLAQDIAVQIISAQMAMMGNGGGAMPPDQLEYMAGAQAGLMLVSLVGQGYLIDEGQSYRTELTFADGTLTVNGNPLPLPLP